MMNEMRTGISVERYSIDYSPQRLGSEAEGHHFGMLVEDIGNQIVPYPSKKGRASQFILERGDPHVTELVVRAFGQKSYDRTVHEAVSNWIRECAVELASTGVAVYEIMYLVQRTNSQKVGFRLVGLDSRQIQNQGDVFVQRVPDGAVLSGSAFHVPPSGVENLELVTIPAQRVFTVEMPHPYKVHWQQLRSGLAYLDAHDPAERIIQILQGSQKNQHTFDWDQHQKTHERAVTEVTRAIGWYGRRIAPAAEGYYWMVRHLRWKRFLITMRDHIIAHVNELLRRTGAEIGFTARLVGNGFPGLAEVNVAEAQLRSGQKTFTEVIEPFDVT